MPSSPTKKKQAPIRRQLTPTASDNPVVAALDNATHNNKPYSSVALSWDRQYAAAACQDTLQMIHIQPSGLRVLKNLPVAHHFSDRASTTTPQRPLQRDTFAAIAFGPPKPAADAFNIMITDVAWSAPPKKSQGDYETAGSLVAAAASNGVIVVWTAASLLQTKSPAVPEAVLSQHVRAVNRLDWHPTITGLLLSASQDGKVLLWERTHTGTSPHHNTKSSKFNRFFGGMALDAQSFSWHCRSIFEPKSEAVRDIRWSPFYEDGA